MQRRSFFGWLASLGAASVIPEAEPAPVPTHPRTFIDEFNASFAGWRYGERVGDYTIFFSGFIPAMDGDHLVGRWHAWPGPWLTAEERQRLGSLRFFVAMVPREPDAPFGDYEHEYQIGESFRISRRLEKGHFLSPDGRVQIAADVAEGRVRLLQVMRNAGVI